MKCDKKIETEHVGSLPIDFFSEELFLTNDHKVTCHTGLPNADLVNSVFDLVIRTFPGCKRRYYWEPFIMTLMKLQLNCGFLDFAF